MLERGNNQLNLIYHGLEKLLILLTRKYIDSVCQAGLTTRLINLSFRIKGFKNVARSLLTLYCKSLMKD
jgi:hypothetical protein